MSKIVCRPRALTPEQAAKVLRRSVEINPENADDQRILARTPVGRRGGPRRLAVVIGHKWPSTGVRLTVQFLDNPARDLRARILLHMNAWAKTTNVQFVETANIGQVRIARLDEPEDMAGYWSYVGTEIEGIEEDQPTFNLEGFTMRTSEAEFHRVVRHEAGHTLGFEHEHMRAELIKKIDRRKAIAYFDRTEGWTAQETIEQVLTPLAKKSIMGTTESDPHSVMCYQIPAEITKDGKEIPGGKDITAKDYAFAATIYPIAKPARDVGAPQPLAVPDTGTTTPFVWTPPAAAGSPAALMTPAVDGDTFHVVVMDRFEPDVAGSAAAARRQKYARVFATYGGARVTIPMRLNTDAGEEHTRFRAIIDMHERIKAYTNREQGTLPTDTELIVIRHRSLRDAVPGRRAAAVRRGALAPARPQARLCLHVDGLVDRREAVGVCLRRVAPQLPCHRGYSLRPQRI